MGKKKSDGEKSDCIITICISRHAKEVLPEVVAYYEPTKKISRFINQMIEYFFSEMKNPVTPVSTVEAAQPVTNDGRQQLEINDLRRTIKMLQERLANKNSDANLRSLMEANRSEAYAIAAELFT